MFCGGSGFKALDLTTRRLCVERTITPRQIGPPGPTGSIKRVTARNRRKLLKPDLIKIIGAKRFSHKIFPRKFDFFSSELNVYIFREDLEIFRGDLEIRQHDILSFCPRFYDLSVSRNPVSKSKILKIVIFFALIFFNIESTCVSIDVPT